VATITTFGLSSSPQQCYLHCFCTISIT